MPWPALAPTYSLNSSFAGLSSFHPSPTVLHSVFQARTRSVLMQGLCPHSFHCQISSRPSSSLLCLLHFLNTLSFLSISFINLNIVWNKIRKREYLILPNDVLPHFPPPAYQGVAVLKPGAWNPIRSPTWGTGTRAPTAIICFQGCLLTEIRAAGSWTKFSDKRCRNPKQYPRHRTSQHQILILTLTLFKLAPFNGFIFSSVFNKLSCYVF